MFQVSGREVFEFRPELVDDDDEEADDTRYAKDSEDEEEDNTEEVGQVIMTPSAMGEALCAPAVCCLVAKTGLWFDSLYKKVDIGFCLQVRLHV